MQGAWVRALGGEDPLEKGMALHSSSLPVDRRAWRATVHGGHKESDMAEWLNLRHNLKPCMLLMQLKQWTVMKLEI